MEWTRCVIHLFYFFLLLIFIYSLIQIRNNIVFNGMNCPSKFPNGEKILAVIPQMLCDSTAIDKHGMPISFMATNFSIKQFSENVTSDEYRQFIMYALEFQNVVCEQLGNAQEKVKLEEQLDSTEPYGVILQAVNIRDLSGLGMEHCSGKALEISKMMTVIARDNYPEMLRKMIIVNGTKSSITAAHDRPTCSLY